MENKTSSRSQHPPADAALRAAVADACGDPLLALDAEGRIVFWNAAAVAVYGWSERKVLGKHLAFLYPPEKSSEAEDLRESALASAGPVRVTARHLGRQGPVEVEIAVKPLPAVDGGGLVLVCHRLPEPGVEDARRVQEVEATRDELEAFSESVSHDLRAPLRAIHEFSQALLADYGVALGEAGKDYLKRIRSAAGRMGQLTIELLEVSRVTRVEVGRQQVDLTALAEDVLDELRVQAPNRSVDMSVTPGLVDHGDPALLRLALEHLLGNAWKFTTHTREPRIVFSSQPADSGDENGRIYFVADNGAGFDMAEAHRLFTPFQRLHSLEEFEGTGIGLATVRRIVQKHGGSIWAKAAPGRGVTFFFTLAPGIVERGGPRATSPSPRGRLPSRHQRPRPRHS